jgi:F-type H+-transporting ATPase subunit b
VIARHPSRGRGAWAGPALACAISVAPSAALAAEGGAGLGQALITPRIGTIFWTLLTFVIMVVILRRFAWGPLLAALELRQRSIQETIDQAKLDRAQAQELLQEHRDLVSEARRERAQAVERGRQDAERIKAEILEDARGQRERLMQQTTAQLEAGLRQAQQELRATAADLAIRAAEKLIATNLDEAGHRRLVEDYLADLERSKGASRPLPS